MLKKNKNDYKKRQLYSKIELKIKIMKFLLTQIEKIDYCFIKNIDYKTEIKNYLISINYSYYLIKQINKLKKKSLKIQLKNRCIWTGNSKVIYKKFKMCRHKLKYYFLNKEIPGYYRYDW